MKPLSGIGSHFMRAVYIPFSFILFYEVLLLVLALPKSITSSICKQYEIISLILVRQVFKDIGAFEDLDSWLTQPDAVRVVLFDMRGALVMFFAVTLFYRVRQTVIKTETKIISKPLSSSRNRWLCCRAVYLSHWLPATLYGGCSPPCQQLPASRPPLRMRTSFSFRLF